MQIESRINIVFNLGCPCAKRPRSWPWPQLWGEGSPAADRSWERLEAPGAREEITDPIVSDGAVWNRMGVILNQGYVELWGYRVI